MPSSGHVYFIINQKSNTALDLSGQDSRSIIGYHLHKGENQKWKLVEHGNEGWTIQNVAHGKYLDVDIPNTFKDGVRVVAIDTNNPMKWDVRRDEKFGGWRFFIHGSNMNVDLSDNGNAADRTPVTLWGEWEGQHQVWRFERV